MGSGPSFPMVPMTRDKIFIVTGANSGLGYEIAKWTSMMGATVILACRSEGRTQEAIEKMNKEFQAEKAKGTEGLTDSDSLALEYMQLDLASFASVMEFCENFQKSGRKLHVLFCNAGLGLGPFQKSSDGNEMLLQVNYLSHFIIIGKLLGIMKQSGPDCRILLMSSAAHKSGTFDLKTINYEGNPDSYPRLNYYGRSKLYQIMQAAEMGKRLAGSDVTINSIHPGLIDSNFWRDWNTGLKKVAHGAMQATGVAKSPFRGAKCSIDLAVNPKYVGLTGLYWCDSKVVTPNSDARNKGKQEALWQWTMEKVKGYLTEEEIRGLQGTGTEQAG
ncbi:retinol dehydrogenase 14-like [Mya arenaria]|uniref:retinol dehydrogenase 14-like n=1 Tax=Mya arenaria TaxID=6604 RepID=UPI0022E82D3A|nr:retinol dehydrogenase 14-like [Mya arenaria]